MDKLIKRTPSESFAPELMTWRDLITATTDWGGARSIAANNRIVRSATQMAYREVGNYRNWRFLSTLYDYSLDAGVELTGYYDHTGGANERQFNVTSGTIPDWAEFGTIRLNNVPYEVDKNVSSSILTLSLRTNPGQDVGSSGSTVTAKLYRSTYPAPADFVSGHDPQGERSLPSLIYLPPDEFLEMERIQQQAAIARYWTATSHPKLYGVLGVRFYPYPTEKRTLQIVYRRQMRRLGLSGYAAADYTGTATGSSGGTTITISGATPSSTWVGAIVRLSPNTSDIPGNVDDLVPFAYQGAITAISGSALTVSPALPGAFSSVKYVVSDPLDMPQYALNALIFGSRYHLASGGGKPLNEVQMAKQEYMQQMTLAMEGDVAYVPSTRGHFGPMLQDDYPSYVYPG